MRSWKRLSLFHSKRLDLIGSLHVKQRIERVLSRLGKRRASFNDERLVLCEHVPHVVHASLVDGLQALEDVRRLRLPLGKSALDTRRGSRDLAGVCLSALAAKLLRLFLRIFQFLCNCLDVADDVVHLLDIAVFAGPIAQWHLDFIANVLCEIVVCLCEALGGRDNLLPWYLEDAAPC